jgi:dipeptidase E
MKLLLTSAGVTNESIRDALVALLGKPIAECNALCIPTALYGHPRGTPAGTWRFVSGREPRCPMVELGWKSVGVLELTTLPTIARTRWQSWVHAADVLLVNGGDAMYLAYWMRQSGLDDMVRTLDDLVWVGLSAGSMVMTPRIGDDFICQPSITGDDRALGLVDFSIFPHLDHPDMAENSLTHAQRWAAGIGNPSYAIDDQTALQVVDGVVEVIAEGNWRHFGA